MPQPATAQPKPGPTALDAAFAALNSYDHGSSRGALLPIDEAAMKSVGDEAARKALEVQLVSALKRGGSAVAGEFICSKLTLMGSELSVPALAALLNKPEFGTAARNALEAISGGQATKALRDSLSKVVGLQKVGVIHSLGARRDAESVRALAGLLENADPGIVGAAVAALGDIATGKAAKALRNFQTRAPGALRQQLADAILNCAEQLLAARKRADATALYQVLATTSQPKHIRLAAALGLAATTGRE